MQIIDIEAGDPRLASDVLPVLMELRPHLTPESFAKIYREGYKQGLRFTAAYSTADERSETPEKHCVGVAGWRIVITTVADARKLYIDDLVTASDARGRGVGKALMAELTGRARAAGCTILDLDSAVHRKGAHRFYARERLHISAFHYTLPLT